LIAVELAPDVTASLRAMKDHRYQWTEGARSILAEQVKNEIYDGATPYSTYVRGVIVEGNRGVLLTGSGDSALVIEG
jgi:hypothetical protein